MTPHPNLKAQLSRIQDLRRGGACPRPSEAKPSFSVNTECFAPATLDKTGGGKPLPYSGKGAKTRQQTIATVSAAVLLMLAGCTTPTAEEPLETPRPVQTALSPE